MSADETSDTHSELRQLLRVARFQSWALDKLEDEITALFRGEVTPTTPDTGATPVAPSL